MIHVGLQKNPYPLRLDDIVMEKSKLLAKENGRSLNKEIEILLKGAIADYEATTGVLQLPGLSQAEKGDTR
jgi:hypothetical protein